MERKVNFNLIKIRTKYPDPKFHLVISRDEHTDGYDMEEDDTSDIAPN